MHIRLLSLRADRLVSNFMLVAGLNEVLEGSGLRLLSLTKVHVMTPEGMDLFICPFLFLSLLARLFYRQWHLQTHAYLFTGV